MDKVLSVRGQNALLNAGPVSLHDVTKIPWWGEVRHKFNQPQSVALWGLLYEASGLGSRAHNTSARQRARRSQNARRNAGARSRKLESLR